MITKTYVRGVSVSGLPDLTSDVDPTTLSSPAAAKAYAGNDNVFSAAAPSDRPFPTRLALSAKYAGSGSPPIATATVYAWEPEVERWFQVGSVELVLAGGAEAFIFVPLNARGGGEFAVKLAASAPPTGTYTIGVGLDYSPAGGGDKGWAMTPAPRTGVSSTALEVAHVLRATPGICYGVAAQVDPAAAAGTYWLLLCDLAAVPAPGAVAPFASLAVDHQAGVRDLANLGDDVAGVKVSTGAVLLLSTAGPSTYAPADSHMTCSGSVSP